MILIIDSEKVASITIKQSFHELGLDSLEIVKTGAEAKTFLENNKNISSIIINSILDDEDGFKLCQEIKETDAGRKAFIYIIISSLENKTAIDKAKRFGADDITVKPYQGIEFKKRLAHFILTRVVMLVEDDPAISLMVEKVLSRYPVEVITTDDGIKANNMFNSMIPVKLVILDIGLPNMNGIQLVKQIRSKAHWKKTAIVMLTGSTNAVHVKESLTSGANDYIAKPFKVDGLIGRIERYLPDAS